MTYQLNIAIPDELRDKVQAYADKKGISLAAAVRILLWDAIGDD